MKKTAIVLALAIYIGCLSLAIYMGCHYHSEEKALSLKVEEKTTQVEEKELQVVEKAFSHQLEKKIFSRLVEKRILYPQVKTEDFLEFYNNSEEMSTEQKGWMINHYHVWLSHNGQIYRSWEDGVFPPKTQFVLNEDEQLNIIWEDCGMVFFFNLENQAYEGRGESLGKAE